jgi:hypothetical protein
MKTMTCKQLGGPCDLAHHGATADEVIKAQDRHLREMVDGGDYQHQSTPAGHEGPMEAHPRGDPLERINNCQQSVGEPVNYSADSARRTMPVKAIGAIDIASRTGFGHACSRSR